MIKSINSRKLNNDGFSLIELSIALIIVGILIAGAALPYKVWMEEKQREETQDHIEAMANAVQWFVAINGRYPCPAPLGLSRSDPDYGRESDCTDASQSVGSCASGLCIAESNREIGEDASGNLILDFNGDGSIDALNDSPRNPRIRIGAVPFRDLGLHEELTVDGYNNRIVYAVTEFQARNDSPGIAVQADAGGIGIVDNDGDSAMSVPDSADFIVLSHGKDGAGAYSFAGGSAFNCPNSSTLDGENCDGDAIFRSGEYSTATGSNRNDDVVMYEIPANAPRWVVSEDNVNDIYAMRPPGSNQARVASDYRFDWFERFFRTDPSLFTPEQATQFASDSALWVGGNALVEGEIQTNRICDENVENCFSPSMIGGSDPDNGRGMACPDGEFMAGIKDGQPVCRRRIVLQCQDDKTLRGFDTDGEPICGYLPCPSEETEICDTGVTLPDIRHDENHTPDLMPDHNIRRTYACDNGEWEISSTSPGCSCLATTKSICGDSVSLPYTLHGESVTRTGGIYDCTTTVFRCNNGTWQTDSSDGYCSCPTTTRSQSCPSRCGYSGGDWATQERNLDCPNCGTPGPWRTTSTCPATDACPPPPPPPSSSGSSSSSSSGSSSSTSSSSSSTSSTSSSSSGSSGSSSSSSTSSGSSSSSSSGSSSSSSSSSSGSSSSSSSSSGGSSSSSSSSGSSNSSSSSSSSSSSGSSSSSSSGGSSSSGSSSGLGGPGDPPSSNGGPPGGGFP